MPKLIRRGGGPDQQSDGQFVDDVDGEPENLVRMQNEQIRDSEGLGLGRMHDGKSGVCDNNTVSWGRIQNENVLENKDLSGMRMYGGNREVREPQNMVRMPAVNKDEERKSELGEYVRCQINWGRNV